MCEDTAPINPATTGILGSAAKVQLNGGTEGGRREVRNTFVYVNFRFFVLLRCMGHFNVKLLSVFMWKCECFHYIYCGFCELK